ncbi:hypothetical protein B9Z19DRAFT_1065154 [Tuber borchii]|uniref:Endonuclease/exonuclease/phosphatase domain-containing protein n=1 Tax=Tuber borchii TaxID=42251 RepID=A0A2T6ZS72_TUBBO|nr:hypothetical protein B9Z19DRAFT_1065154 [Tuber borchii]
MSTKQNSPESPITAGANGKFARAICLLKKSFDILFIAEHWYQHHKLRLSHPLVYCSTSLPSRSSNNPPRGRQHGGIYLLVKPHIRCLIQSTTCSTYSITVSLSGIRLAGVYYPPYSISNDIIENDLQNIGSIDLLLGDINTKFHPNIFLATKHSKVPNSDRAILFENWTAKTNMLHISDQLQYNISHKIPDHAFTSVHSQPKMTLFLLPTESLQFRTDHKNLLHIQYLPTSPPETTQDHPPSSSWVPALPGPLRFHVQRLKQPHILLHYQKHWSMVQQLFTAFKESESFDIDMLDAILCSAVQAVAESVLGSYEPAESRKQPDNCGKRLVNQLDIASSIQLLKRTQGDN